MLICRRVREDVAVYLYFVNDIDIVPLACEGGRNVFSCLKTDLDENVILLFFLLLNAVSVCP